MFFTTTISTESARIAVRKFLKGHRISVGKLGDGQDRRSPPMLIYSMFTVVPAPLKDQCHPLLDYLIVNSPQYDMGEFLKQVGQAQSLERKTLFERDRLSESIWAGPINTRSSQLHHLFNYIQNNHYFWPLKEIRGRTKRSHLCNSWGWPREYKDQIYIGITENNKVEFTSRWSYKFSKEVEFKTLLKTIKQNDKDG